MNAVVLKSGFGRRREADGMPRLAIHRGWTMLWKGHIARFERRQGNMLEWRVDLTNEHLQFTDHEIADGIANGSLKLSSPPDTQRLDADGKVVRTRIRELSPRAIAEGDRKLRYMKAVRNEGGLIGATQKEKKHLLHRLRMTAGPKELELRDVSVRTLERWMLEDGGRCERNPLIPLHHRKGNRSDRLDELVRDVVERRIDDQWMRRPRVNFDTLRDMINGDVDALNVTRPSSMKLPHVGKKALRNSIARRKPSQLLEAELGAAAATSRFTGRRTLPDPDRPLDRLELDSTKVDVIVLDAETMLPIGRPWLVIATDRCTRMPAGFAVTFDPPSIHTVMECLRSAIFPKTWLKEMREEHEWAVRHDWPVFGKPRTIALDQGMENLSNSVLETCLNIGINEVLMMGRRRPWEKGGIERAIGTVSRGLFHMTPGTTFANVLKRVGYDSSKDAVATLEELEHGITMYLVDIYARRGHRGLSTGLQGRPIDVWNELIDEEEIEIIPDIAEAHQLFGRSFEATIRPTGVPYKNLLFYSEELVAALDDRDFLKLSPRRRVMCRMKTGDIGQIYVEMPHTGELITVPIADKWVAYAQGLSIWQHERIVEYRNAQIAAGEEADDLPGSRRRLAEKMQSGRKSKSGHKVSSKRWEGHGRQARAGSDASTTVPGSDAHVKAQKRKPDRSQSATVTSIDPALIKKQKEDAAPPTAAPSSPYTGRTKTKVV
ncbi:hypothetical protein [uncultured Sphingomonas sp.]|uniref:hypothetical protein n=1 Tax=uncultured Sphingomonas sp. TaxID=158754 RepID=UPI0025E90FD1|nr:hypothetical protein [uncultured Sphingomonas sp.]